jgi:hypothetical protein
MTPLDGRERARMEAVESPVPWCLLSAKEREIVEAHWRAALADRELENRARLHYEGDLDDGPRVVWHDTTEGVRDLHRAAVRDTEQDDPMDRCDCNIPYLEGAGEHSPGCSVFRPVEQRREGEPGCPTAVGDAALDTRFAELRSKVQKLDGRGLARAEDTFHAYQYYAPKGNESTAMAYAIRAYLVTAQPVPREPSPPEPHYLAAFKTALWAIGYESGDVHKFRQIARTALVRAERVSAPAEPDAAAIEAVANAAYLILPGKDRLIPWERMGQSSKEPWRAKAREFYALFAALSSSTSEGER